MIANDGTPVNVTDVVGAFSFKTRLRSFRYAAAGIGFMLRREPNARIHLLIATVMCLAGLWLRLSAADWRWLIAAIVLVWAAEAINTAFEHLCDAVSPEFSPSVARTKDIAAGAVLICAGGAVALGVLTFWPYLVR
jgi:diacylglycerol kinase (ATP)